MSHAQMLSESASTRQLLSNLNLAIEEARLVKEIMELRDQLHGITRQDNAFEEAQILQQEIDHREDRLVVLRSTIDTVTLSFRYS